MRYNKSINKGGDANENDQFQAAGISAQETESAGRGREYKHEYSADQDVHGLSGQNTEEGMSNTTNKTGGSEMKHYYKTKKDAQTACNQLGYLYHVWKIGKRWFVGTEFQWLNL
jgi:hypothetical protein